jgi:hypothetical protein
LDSHVVGWSSGIFSIMGPVSVALLSSHLSNSLMSLSSRCIGGKRYGCATGLTAGSTCILTHLVSSHVYL